MTSCTVRPGDYDAFVVDYGTLRAEKCTFLIQYYNGGIVNNGGKLIMVNCSVTAVRSEGAEQLITVLLVLSINTEWQASGDIVLGINNTMTLS